MRIIRTTLICLACAVVPASAEVRNPLQDGETWADLRYDIIGDVSLTQAPDRFDIDAPFRAHDPALVPVRLLQPANTDDMIEELTLVIDENPAPVAAVLTLSPAMHPLEMELRVRVDAYSNLRAIARTAAGENFMAGRFVRATGGCAAPAGKDAAAALLNMGKMRLQVLESVPDEAGLRHKVKLMVRHPNYSGLQRDQRTLLNIPAHFIDQLEVRQGEDLLFSVVGGISVSEDPVFEFRFLDNATPDLHVRAVDTKGTVFEQFLPLEVREEVHATQ